VTIDAYLSEQSQAGGFSGSVLASRGQELRLDQGCGFAERSERRPNTPDTAFQIASVSKQFTAASILILQERGLLSVHDRVSSWISDGPEGWEAITIHHLLTHTAGIGHWQDFPDVDLYEPTTRADLIRIFQQKPLKFHPGSAWFYSSPAYVLLAHIVEQVARKPYAHVLREEIFTPLGLASTGVGNLPPHPEQRAVGYSGGERTRSFDLDDVGIGAGDIWSTTRDLARWDAALRGAGFLSEASLAAMFTPYAAVPNSDEDLTDMRYGYGWFIARLRGRRIVFHPGDNAGFQSFNELFPDDDAILILLTNDDRTNLARIITHVTTSLFEDDDPER
jgi:CubicO group peptidase (beta-lactamase class C family)